MKKLILSTIACLFICGNVLGQSRVVEKTFSFNPNDQLRLDLKFGDTISVKSWDKNKVSFKAVIEINQGKLNDALDLTFNRDNGLLKIGSDYNKKRIKDGMPCNCSDNHYSQFSWGDHGHYTICTKIQYEILVPANADVKVESISGNIELVNLNGPIRAKSISGFVDVSWPTGKPASVDMKTISGEAYTNFDELQFENKKDHIPIVGYKLKGTLGKGGPNVSLESVSGNIYLRRSSS